MNLAIKMGGLTLKGSSPNAFLNNTTIARRFKHEYAPRFKIVQKKQKGRVPVRTGGSIKGSTLQFGKYGLRLKSEGIRISAQQLKEADNAIMRYVRPLNNGHLWRRLCTNVAVCIKGNETRMGKGKGGFDHWMVRVPTGKILFEINGDDLHEKVARKPSEKQAPSYLGYMNLYPWILWLELDYIVSKILKTTL